MFCPLKKQTVIDEDGSVRWLSSDTFGCDRESCGWWFGAQECCSMQAIANNLTNTLNKEE